MSKDRVRSWLVLLLVLSSFALGAGWLTKRVGEVREAASVSACQGCLSNIGTALLRYHEKYGAFPPAYLADPAGNPAHSWRVLLLEFLDHDLYLKYKFDESWDGPNNRQLESRMPNCYSCPADKEGKARFRTNYFVVVGEQTMFPGAKAVSLQDVGGPNSSTILVVESVGRDVHWMQPEDLTLDSLSLAINDPSAPSISSRHRDGASVCTIDGTKLRLDSIAPEKLKSLLVVPTRKR